MLLNVVIGGSTRLAAALINNCFEPTDSLLLAARDRDEATQLSRLYGHARIFPLWEPLSIVTLSITEVRVYCCALGIIHPGTIAFDDDLHAASRDLKGLTQLVSFFPRTRMHVVFVSSILAFRPSSNCAYYSGWKNVIGSVVSDLISSLEHGNVSIIFPGRLIEKRSAAHPTTLLHSSYTSLAKVMQRVSKTRDNLQKVVGVDARLWLGLQSLVLVRKSFLG